MPARKPGGKYKGKVGRAKGEATIAAELEFKRRQAYEANLRSLQQRREADALAKAGLAASAEEEEQDMKLQKIAQLFGDGKKGTLKKFWKNWKIGVIHLKREAAIHERQNCWRKSCGFCTEDGDCFYDNFKEGHKHICKNWWQSALGRDEWGEELNPLASAADRHPDVNYYRSCYCCKCDTGYPAMGCRAWEQLTDACFESPLQHEQRERKQRESSRLHLAPLSRGSASGRSASTPSLRLESPRKDQMTLSAYENMLFLISQDDVPVFDPSMPFALTEEQEILEERRRWAQKPHNIAGSVERRLDARTSGTLALPPLTGMTLAPKLTAKRKPLQQVAHWRTGQKTMLDKHMMQMYVVGGME